MTMWPNDVKPPWDLYTPRGIHGPDDEHHTDWLGTEDQVREHGSRLAGMRVSNMTIRSSSDSILEVHWGMSTLEWLLAWQILTIIRFSGRVDRKMGGFLETVVPAIAKIGRRFGLKRIPMIPFNEPNDDREYAGEPGDDWKEVVYPNIMDAMWRIWNLGGSPGFPDPLGEWSWFFEKMRADGSWKMFRDGHWWFAGHFYCKNRPLDYPMDQVSRYGTPLTEDEHRAALGDFYELWKYDPPLDLINEQRQLWANPETDWRDDATCHGGWRNVRDAAWRLWGCNISVANTEGGPTPKSPAGDGLIHPIDNRFPHHTPDMVAKLVIDIERHQAEHGLWANCNWLYQSDEWGYDSWVTGAYRGVDMQKYWLEMPAVYAYRNNAFAGPPPPPYPPAEPPVPPAQEQVHHHVSEIADAARISLALLK